MSDVDNNPAFATWRLPGQPIFSFQSKPRQIIVYSSSMKEDPVPIESSILLLKWNKVHDKCPPMYTKDIVNCDPVKHFIPEFQPTALCINCFIVSNIPSALVKSIFTSVNFTTFSLLLGFLSTISSM